jgi:phage shock protein A
VRVDARPRCFPTKDAGDLIGAATPHDRRRERSGTVHPLTSSYATKGDAVILHKFWSAFLAQINKVANLFWEADPIAQLRYEYDRAVEQLKEGRTGLEQYRGLVERVTRQVSANKSQVQRLEAETRAYLKAGDRKTAAKFALELQKAKEELAANDQQLQMHETAYGNNLRKIQHANEKLIELREKIQKYDAELKMSAAEAEIAKLAQTFDMNLTTDFGEIESVIQQKIDQNRGKVRVAADLSAKGIAEIDAEDRMRTELAEQALQDFEVELGLRSPETTPIAPASKDLGPATAEAATERQTS